MLTGRRIERYYCPEEELLDAARRVYGSTVARMIADLKVEVDAADDGEAKLTGQLQEMAREPSVVNLVNLILLEGLEARASDVHVEPFEKVLKVKYRIDGILHEVSPPPKHLQPAIVSRVKIMAGMNIAERFVPQDGHIAFAGPHGHHRHPRGHRAHDLRRVRGHAHPGPHGLADQLERLGMNPQGLALFAPMLDRPHGIVLVTGPTGSGKTTTLYAALNKIYTPAKKIITIEDPVEYQLEGINQIPVNRKRGVDFANGLRAILRQDPDVIMVGEIRDRETADIAIRSALTGHLVFSTLHTNDAPGAVARLIDMGVEPYLLASSLEGVLAQRLVRTICPNCRVEHQPEAEVLERMGHRPSDSQGRTLLPRAGLPPVPPDRLHRPDGHLRAAADHGLGPHGHPPPRQHRRGRRRRTGRPSAHAGGRLPQGPRGDHHAGGGPPRDAGHSSRERNLAPPRERDPCRTISTMRWTPPEARSTAPWPPTAAKAPSPPWPAGRSTSSTSREAAAKQAPSGGLRLRLAAAAADHAAGQGGHAAATGHGPEGRPAVCCRPCAWWRPRPTPRPCANLAGDLAADVQGGQSLSAAMEAHAREFSHLESQHGPRGRDRRHAGPGHGIPLGVRREGPGRPRTHPLGGDLSAVRAGAGGRVGDPGDDGDPAAHPEHGQPRPSARCRPPRGSSWA